MNRCVHDWKEIRSIPEDSKYNYDIFFYCSKCLDIQVIIVDEKLRSKGYTTLAEAAHTQQKSKNNNSADDNEEF